LFRDESERVKRKIRIQSGEETFVLEQFEMDIFTAYPTEQMTIPSDCDDGDAGVSPYRSAQHTLPSSYPFQQPPITPSKGLTQTLSETAAHFFFSNYTCDEPPLSTEYYSWLTTLYFSSTSNGAIRAAIEAAGLAGIANKSYAPHIAAKAKHQYGKALVAANEALQDPKQALADSTFLSVILLGTYEVSLIFSIPFLNSRG
jgi:hypothetical protein